MPRAGGGLTGSAVIGCTLRRRPLALAALSCGNSRQSTAPVCGSTRWTCVRSQAAKRTSELIPLAHPIAVSRVAVEFELLKKAAAIVVRARVECRGPTGVEMEALTAAAIGLLTIYDMVKAVDRGMTLGSLRLEEKLGGKSGVFRRPVR